MKRGVGILVAAGVALLATQAGAHHSFTATYFADQTVTIQGELAQVHLRNPHSIVHVIVKDKEGREVRYAVEWAGAGQLEAQGVTSQTLKTGDFVVITGSPVRHATDHRVRMLTLRRPKDNYEYGAKR